MLNCRRLREYYGLHNVVVCLYHKAGLFKYLIYFGVLDFVNESRVKNACVFGDVREVDDFENVSLEQPVDFLTSRFDEGRFVEARKYLGWYRDGDVDEILSVSLW